MTLRIYADFNSGGTNGSACWLLRYNGRLLDEMAAELALEDGMLVTLFYEDPGEEFEVTGQLIAPRMPKKHWEALPDWSTLRRIRG